MFWKKCHINDDKNKQEACWQNVGVCPRGEGSQGYRNSNSITQQGFHRLLLTSSPVLSLPCSYWGTCMGVVRQQSFHLLSAEIQLRKHAFRVMLGLFISYKDVIRQISSADSGGCVFNGCMLPRLVISSSRCSKITHCTRGLASVTWQPVTEL